MILKQTNTIKIIYEISILILILNLFYFNTYKNLMNIRFILFNCLYSNCTHANSTFTNLILLNFQIKLIIYIYITFYNYGNLDSTDPYETHTYAPLGFRTLKISVNALKADSVELSPHYY